MGILIRNSPLNNDMNCNMCIDKCLPLATSLKSNPVAEAHALK
jgi:hypothetical protein